MIIFYMAPTGNQLRFRFRGVGVQEPCEGRSSMGLFALRKENDRLVCRGSILDSMMTIPQKRPVHMGCCQDISTLLGFIVRGFI